MLFKWDARNNVLRLNLKRNQIIFKEKNDTYL